MYAPEFLRHIFTRAMTPMRFDVLLATVARPIGYVSSISDIRLSLPLQTLLVPLGLLQFAAISV